MKISLNRDIFTKDPDERFAKIQGVEIGILNQIYDMRPFTFQEVKSFYLEKTNKTIDRTNIWRWVKRKEIYDQAQKALKKGQYYVDLDYFGEHKDFLMNEFTKHLR